MPTITTRQAPTIVQGSDWTAHLWCRTAPKGDHEKTFSLLARDTGANSGSLNELLKPFGFDFAFILVRKSLPEIEITLGPRCTFQLYWNVSTDTGEICITDHLPHAMLDQNTLRDSLDIEWLHTFMAHGQVSGPMEFSPSTRTIYQDWKKVPASHSVRLCSKSQPVLEKCIAFDNISDEKYLGWSGPEQVSDFVRQALRQHLRETCGERGVAVEFSGGIDSGLVIAEACLSLPGKPAGVRNAYSYPEFRREIIYQEAIRKKYGFHVFDNEQRDILPFAGLLTVPAHDEPSVLSTSWGHLSAMHAYCQRENISTLLTGHGGDTLFEISPALQVQQNSHGDLPGMFGSVCRSAVRQEAGAIRDFLNHKPQDWVLARHWHPAILDSSFINRIFTHHALHPLIYTSGLISPDLVNGLHAYWLLSRRAGRSSVRPIQKPLAHEIFGDLLPEAVWRRSGKVNHLGLAYRGLFKSQADIAQLESCIGLFAPLLEFDTDKVKQFLQSAANGLHSGEGWLSRILALLVWTHARTRGAIA